MIMQRIALVTGGTRGIGAAIAKELKQKGYQVIASYQVNEVKAEKFQKETSIPVKKWDVSNYDECQKAVSEITKHYGPIDILVNNAGITRDGFLHKANPQMWQEVINTNLTSCFNMTHCVLNNMRERAFGRIINISSINAQKGQAGQVNYSAAKAGIIGFTKALALECAMKGITVNAVAPGYIDTDMVRAVAPEVLQKIIAQVPAGRLGMADEVAHAVAFLADDKSSFINGATLSLNGAQYLA
jgi:acetoacetyl-CoA reductase